MPAPDEGRRPAVSYGPEQRETHAQLAIAGLEKAAALVRDLGPFDEDSPEADRLRAVQLVVLDSIGAKVAR